MGHLLTHIELAGSALAAAIAIAVPLAAWLAGRSALHAVAFAGIGALRVIPSLAILTLTLPFLGLGFGPAFLALVVLAIPPIAVNTDVALRSIAPALVDAARGLGMTPRDVRRRVEWPLAMPVVIAGIRTATVEVIASATLASFIGGGGLGDYIIDGLATDNTALLLAGAASVAALALAADGVLALVSRRVQVR